MAKLTVAARNASNPRRVTAVRSSVICLPPGLRAAELAIDSTRVASIGSAPITRTTRSLLEFSSDSAFCTRLATSGKLGSSMVLADSSSDRSRTNSKAAVLASRCAGLLDSTFCCSGRTMLRYLIC